MPANKIIAEFIAYWVDTYYRGNQTDFAKAIGVEQPTVSRWINERMDVKRENLEKISSVTGISIDSILNKHWAKSVAGAMPTAYMDSSKSVSVIPAALQRAIAWHIEHGEDPDAVALAASKSLVAEPNPGQLNPVQWARRIGDWLVRISVLS